MALKELHKSVGLQQLRALSIISLCWTRPHHQGSSVMDVSWFLCLSVALALALALLVVQFKLRMFRRGPREPPHLPALPVIGSLLSLRSSHPHVHFKELQEKYGQTYSLMMGSHSVVIVNQHAHAKEVLLKKGKTFAGRPRTVGISLV